MKALSKASSDKETEEPETEGPETEETEETEATPAESMQTEVLLIHDGLVFACPDSVELGDLELWVTL